MELTCPACGSEEIYRGVNRRKHIVIWYLCTFIVAPSAFSPLTFPLALLWMLYPFVLPLFETWKCRACGARATMA